MRHAASRLGSPRAIFEQAADHAARFREQAADRPPWPTLTPAAIARAFAGPTPQLGQSGYEVIEALVQAAEPGLSGTTGPHFFGWVIGASDPVGVAADMLTSAWGQNAGNQVCSPAAAAAEQAAAAWLIDMLRLPPESSVGFVTGATMAGFVCLAAARNEVLRRAGWDVEAGGLTGAPPIRVLAGKDLHVTILCALRYLGLGSRPTLIDTDGQGRMDPKALSAALAAGSGPAIVIAQAGQINTGAFDPFTDIAAACKEHGAWLHIDGAFGLWARILEEMDAVTEGIELADSWSVDGHKWLQLPYDSGFAIVADKAAHRRAMEVHASYLPTDEALADPGQYVPELSRRARGFAAWAVIRSLGRDGIAAMVRGHCALARSLAAQLVEERGVTVLNQVILNQVIVAFGERSGEERDRDTQAVIDALKEENLCLAGGSTWRDRWVLRLSIISGPLTQADIDRLAATIKRAWRLIRAHTNEAVP